MDKPVTILCVLSTVHIIAVNVKRDPIVRLECRNRPALTHLWKNFRAALHVPIVNQLCVQTSNFRNFIMIFTRFLRDLRGGGKRLLKKNLIPFLSAKTSLLRLTDQ